jgi:hypothetical protein
MYLPLDFREFLILLNSAGVEYLVIGGYAVGYHGYPRTTADIDVWIATSETTAGKMIAVFREFGFTPDDTIRNLLLKPDQVIRMGLPPVRIEVLTGISGREFADCYARRIIVPIEGADVPFISLADLKANKKASGRHKDLDDLDHLPE